MTKEKADLLQKLRALDYLRTLVAAVVAVFLGYLIHDAESVWENMVVALMAVALFNLASQQFSSTLARHQRINRALER